MEEADNHTVVLKNLAIENLSAEIIFQLSYVPESVTGNNVNARYLATNEGLFSVQASALLLAEVKVRQVQNQLALSCSCGQGGSRLCEHQAQVLYAIVRQPDLGFFFNEKIRLQKLKVMAATYGLENESEPEKFFKAQYTENKLVLTPLHPSLLPITTNSLAALSKLLVPKKEVASTAESEAATPVKRCLVMRQHKFYKHLFIELYEAGISKDGKLKNPLTFINPQELIWETSDVAAIKFYTAITRFQSTITTPKSALDISSLRAIVANPFQLDVYLHDSTVSEKITTASLMPVGLQMLTNSIALTVQKKGGFYELSGRVMLEDAAQPVNGLEVLFGYFIFTNSTLYLVKDLQAIELVKFFTNKPAPVLIHADKYTAFKGQILEKLEVSNPVDYTYVKPASPQQLQQQGFNTDKEKIIYLTDVGLHVHLTPVLKYGDVEVPIRTKQHIIATDAKGKEFYVQREVAAEDAFMAFITRQHPDFAEQLQENDLSDFYLHRQYFLNEEWFLPVFEEWQNQGIKILGFNEITNNRLNLNKAKISVQVVSGINWFNVVVKMKYGRQTASLKAVRKAVKEGSKFVLLDDGTKGILPAEWLEKLTAYFNAADVSEDDLLLIPKTAFTTVQELYEEELWSEEVKSEIHTYAKGLAHLEAMPAVPVPEGLLATLRPYQQQGLAWLCYLDSLNFGGCLADDMGLGKTVQIIAFILAQRSPQVHNTNLVVVPTSLLFNWQAEVQRFAPSIRVLTLHGAGRVKSSEPFGGYEIILTSYGTLLSDIASLRKDVFNCIFLDESQNIKNPESQRYKAVRLLQSRNKFVLTGTPIENNTFDIYGQLSFACPGLLGGKKYFRDVYSTPIDKFKVSRRAAELQAKIKPFILRRTKAQVLTELPDKTETVLYCEMGAAQQAIYDAYEREIREYIMGIENTDLPAQTIHVLRSFTRLRQICNSPLLLKEEKIQEAASAKIETLLEQIETKAPQHKMLVFSQFVSMLELIRAELDKRHLPCAWLTGSTVDRDAAVQRFQNDPEVRIFLISLKAGGTGLNLTAASYVYLVDPWWNPAVEQQAIDRSYRIGQHKNVIASRLICKGTVEEKMLQLQEAKKQVAGRLISEAAMVQGMTKEDLLGLVS